MSACVHLRHVDPAKNMARFYVLALQPTLFGEVALVREWGRIGSPGRVQVTAYATPEEAEAALRRIERQKERRGYLQYCQQFAFSTKQQGENAACAQGALLPS